jgi:hypothetical protein
MMASVKRYGPIRVYVTLIQNKNWL